MDDAKTTFAYTGDHRIKLEPVFQPAGTAVSKMTPDEDKLLRTALTLAPPLRFDHAPFPACPNPSGRTAKTRNSHLPTTSPVRAERFIPPDMSVVVRFGQRRT